MFLTISGGSNVDPSTYEWMNLGCILFHMGHEINYINGNYIALLFW